MSAKPQNPPAFPQSVEAYHGSEGMSLRDWFAGQALAGYIASCGGKTWTDESYVVVATGMYRMADALLAERERGA